jgi:hypothetical protein
MRPNISETAINTTAKKGPIKKSPMQSTQIAAAYPAALIVGGRRDGFFLGSNINPNKRDK